MVFPALVLEPDEFKVNVGTVQFSSSPSSQATSSKPKIGRHPAASPASLSSASLDKVPSHCVRLRMKRRRLVPS